jgi:hypothetical protein
MRQHVLAIEPNGLAVGGDGLVRPALLEQGGAEGKVGVGMRRVKFDGLLVGGDGVCQPA